MAGVHYAAGRTPWVSIDCSWCDGTGEGYHQPCVGCKGRGYFRHLVSQDCDCDGCREFRGEIDEDGNEVGE